MTGELSVQSTERYWEDFYGGGHRGWSGNPNALLVAEASGLGPGTALDLGCAQGDDAIWLAAHGWRVTAVDVSPTALGRAADRAAAAGVGEAITWERHDLAASFPSGTFDLVTASYLHSPLELPRERILRSAAAAVAPGGTLLVVGHAGSPSWADHGAEHRFATPAEVLADLALPPGHWRVRRSAVVTVEMTRPDGEPGTRPDNVLNVARIAAANAA